MRFDSEEAARLYALSRATAKPAPPREFKTWQIVAAAVVGIVVISSLTANQGTRPIDAVDAQVNCEGRIRKMLKAPSTAEFAPFREQNIVGTGSGPYAVTGYVDAQNSFGVRLRNNYTCTVEFKGDQAYFSGVSLN